MQGRSLRAARKMEDALKAARAGPLILRRRDGLRRRGAFLLRWRGRNKKRICCGANVTYHNGAKVTTSFVTNLGTYLAETAPELHERIEAASRENEKKGKKQADKLEYPMELATAARLQWLSIHGVHYYIREGEGTFVRKLDGMSKGKSIYGNGFLLSERAAAERTAAERTAAQRFALSPREWAIVRSMSGFPERVSE